MEEKDLKEEKKVSLHGANLYGAKEQEFKETYTREEYQQLAGIANNLYQDVRKYQEENMRLQNDTLLMRLNFLFDVIRNREHFNDFEFAHDEAKGFMDSVTMEIIRGLYPDRKEEAKAEEGGS
ncbi:MAG: hypothetical protein LBE56_12385 [Tannerella sp.]|jgi:hypothetical protein|nr:hypothetical protein [Tannerella sp.]